MSFFGHHHLNVNDVDAHVRFFADALGGTKLGPNAIGDASIRFPNALVVLRQQPPSGGTKGTIVNHFAFGVPDIRRAVDRVKADGWPMVTRAETAPTQDVEDDLAFMVDQQTHVAFTMAPDETKVEFIEMRDQASAIAAHHVHFLTPHVAEMQAWYMKTLGATPRKRGKFETADLPGINLTYSPSPSPVVGTRGRALDHIGFEVPDLDAVCRRLVFQGIAVDETIADTPIHVRSVFLTDPWGTLIELTEGLETASRSWSG
jgi:catechol 2,3-dioxygenase-like lactoylglutathione lyase family enzyme